MTPAGGVESQNPGERMANEVSRAYPEHSSFSKPARRKEDAMLPLVSHVQPGRHVKLEIMAGSAAEAEERKQHSQRSKNGQAQRDQPRGQTALRVLICLR